MAQSQPRLDAPECRPRLHVLGSFELRVPSDTNRENGRENGTGSTITSATSSVIAATAITSAIASPDERRLLALLALSGTSRPHQELAAILWPERSTDAALGTLAGVCDSLGDLTVSTGTTLRLAERVEVDLTHALGLLRAWEQNPHALEASSSDEMIDLLARDVLPDWTEEWVLEERERFRQVRLHALESLCRRLTQAGWYRSAIRAGLLVIEADPLRESARRALIEAHLAAGNLSEAARQYEAFVRNCFQLGLPPTAELSDFFPPSPPVLRVRRPIHVGGAVGRGLRVDAPNRRVQAGVAPGNRS